MHKLVAKNFELTFTGLLVSLLGSLQFMVTLGAEIQDHTNNLYF